MAQPKSELNLFTFLLQSRRGLLCVLGMAALLSGPALSAQDNTLVLHVNTTLVQIPVLVLTPTYDQMRAPIPANQFSIQFGGGPPLRPKYVRLEGEDPIDLAIVLDTRAPQEEILPKIDQAIAELAPKYLHTQDHVSIYAMDCSGVHSMEDVAAEPGQLKQAADVALSDWMARRQGKKMPVCKQNTILWDVLAYVTSKLSKQPGRRVILAVTNGDDRHSRRTADDVTNMAQSSSVTILGLDPSQEASSSQSISAGTNSRSRDAGVISQLRESGEITLSSLCEQSGGVMLDLSRSSVSERLRQFTEMLRGRYILEFPRPRHGAGKLELAVTIDKVDAFIRPAGNGVPVVDRESVADVREPVVEQPAAPQVESHPEEAATAPVAEQQSVAVPAPQQPISSPVAGEQPEGPPVAALVFKVSTRLTVEDVTATDAKRAPVFGLLQPDFILKEDGRPQAIRNFEEYGAEKPQAAAAQLPGSVYDNAQPPASTAGAINILLLDNVSTGLAKGLAMAPENLAYAKEQSIKYLETMPAGTRVVILEMGSTLRLVQGMTSDRAKLLAAMHAVSYKPVPGAYVMQPGNGAACQAANAQSELTVNALEQMAAFLSGAKERKNVIWFTPGAPWLTDHGAFSMVGCLRDYTAALQRDYGLLNAAEVALYPVDPRGIFSSAALTASSTMSLENCGTCNVVMAQGQKTAQVMAAFNGSTSAEHDSLQEMADATGGVPYFNRNDVEAAVREAVATGGHYYSLSYVPPLSKYDDKYHTIEVKVDRPGVSLQYRKGYTAVDLKK